jgi:BASS family bile acid:Na+ symporter
MGALAQIFQSLAWLGRQGTRAIAASIFVGLALPPLAALFKPLVAPSIFCLLVFAFLRVNPVALRSEFARPWIVLLATFWIMVATPLALGAAYARLGGGEFWNSLSLALVLQAAAPPIMSAPAFVALLGLDAALALATLIATITVTPFTTPLFVGAFARAALPLDPPMLALRLFFFLAGSFLVAAFIRWLFGRDRVLAAREQVDGLSVVALFVFAVALMESVGARLLSEPGLVLGLLALSFALTFGLMALTALVFRPIGIERALALGFSCGNRNMGLMLAAAGSVPDIVWLYIALLQFPIYLGPQLLSPLIHRLLRPRLPDA